jgi:hypothetical protein
LLLDRCRRAKHRNAYLMGYGLLQAPAALFPSQLGFGQRSTTQPASRTVIPRYRRYHRLIDLLSCFWRNGTHVTYLDSLRMRNHPFLLVRLAMIAHEAVPHTALPGSALQGQLRRLQQYVRELLIKNQELRMLLQSANGPPTHAACPLNAPETCEETNQTRGHYESTDDSGE